MSRITLSASQLRSHAAAYIEDAAAITEGCLTACRSSRAFDEIYHTSLSADFVLRGLGTPNLRPRIGAARSITLRVPLLVTVGQLSVAALELRRFTELVCWTVYFSSHPVEWRSFESGSSSGFSQDMRKPIAYAAHRELGYYIEYARELMACEASGLGIQCVDALKQASHGLNRAIHAGELAKSRSGVPVVDTVSDRDLRDFGRIQRQVFSNACVLLAAYKRSRFDQLSAAARAHFDWLLGPKMRRRLRGGPFGL